ncbi:MAG: DUF3500 domain-containing protein [Rhodothermales bacterium]
MRSAMLPAVIALLGLTATSAPAQNAAPSMTEAATAFLALLDEDDARQAMMPFDGDERFNFHFTPVPRKGLTLKDMSLDQRRAVHALLRSGLSSRGYLKATSVMQLENILRQIEEPGWTRDRALYYVSIFGTPLEDEPWGWRLEGHHLSLNYTSVSDALTVTTPAFYGSNPAEVRTGPTAGLRVLGAEEDLARHLVSLLNAEQRRLAVINEAAPRDIITGNDRSAQLEGYEGLAAAEMTTEQKEALWRLIREYTGNQQPELAEQYLEKVERAGIESFYFAWAGGLDRGDQHYYRVHGPMLLIEYDNTQGDGNHVHSVLRDLENDFGGDLLRRHYEEHTHD